MKTGYRRRLGTIAIFAAALLSLLAAGACSNTVDEVADLLIDPKIWLRHLNEELHTIKGEELLANPKFGLAHLNDEFHTIRGTLADPKFGLAHLNDEFHTIKQTLAELTRQLESLQGKVQ